MDREIIHGNPVGKANHYLAVPDTANGGKRIILDDIYRAYQRSFIQQCTIYKGRNIDRPFIFFMHAWLRTNAQDVDNILKSVLDLLQDVHAISNDALCRELHCVKHVDPIHPRIEFGIVELEPRLF